PQSPTNTADNIYVALYDYVARTSTQLTFKKGDKMELINPNEGDWWVVRLIDEVTSQLEGYVPSNYIATCSSLESQPKFELASYKQAKLMKKLRHSKLVQLYAVCTRSQPFYIVTELMCNGSMLYYLKVADFGLARAIKVGLIGPYSYFVSKFVLPELSLCVEYYGNKLDENPQTDGLSHEFADKYEGDHSEFKLGKKLGEGNFGKVFEGLWNGTTKVAVKTLKQGTSEQESFLKEAKLMKKLRHPKLVQLYAVCTRSEPFYIVTELMCNGSLLDYLRDHEDLNQLILIDMAAQIASGMAYLETNNYIYRDLAARNILVGKNNCVKVADFGLARAIKVGLIGFEEIYESTSKKFPVKWSAPEAALQKNFSIKSDVWSFGILLTEIIGKGREPYPGWDNKEILPQVESGYRMPKLPDCTDSLYAIMLNCWDADPKKRNSFETLLCKLEDAY
uniref:non-specific protein-tyrosine kinase n=1 Tax=Ciona savignyi TaxID=51511 RepID=H2YT87_CIOSA